MCEGCLNAKFKWCSARGTFLRSTAATAVVRLSHRNSVCLSVTRVDQSKMVQAGITKSSPSILWKTLVSGTVKVFYKFEGGGHPNENDKWERGRDKISDFQPVRRWQTKTGHTLWWVQVKHYRWLAAGRLAPSGD